MSSESPLVETMAQALARIASLEAQLKWTVAERDQLRESHRQLQIELELTRRRIFSAKAERIDTRQLEIEFEAQRKKLDALAGLLGQQSGEPPPKNKAKSKPKGRRDLKSLRNLPIEDIVIADPEMERLVEQGAAERVDFEESARVKWRRGGTVIVVIKRLKYRLAKDESSSTLVTAPMPETIIARSMGTPSLYAKIAADKFLRGMPLYRQEEQFKSEGCPIDRSTMCRWLEELGATVGASVVHAARREALQSAFCLSTDATGISVQPIPTPDKKRQACKKGHFFVVIADRDHVLFEYTERERSSDVLEMFRGYSGYVQADAKSVYDILFRDHRDEPPDGAAPDFATRSEVGCWYHARRGFWEAAVAAKEVTAREALMRIGRLFDNESRWRELSPAERKQMRLRFSRPEIEGFFAWAEIEYRKVEHQRGLLRSALGYVRNQRDALMRFLDDGRLEMDNNRSERELRRVAVGRKAWLFVGSDDHAQAAANLFSLIASAQLHRLDPEAYLRDLFRVLPHWPAERYLELAPKYWGATRDRLDPAELDREIGLLAVPPVRAPSTGG